MKFRYVLSGWLLRVAFGALVIAIAVFYLWHLALSHYGRGWTLTPESADWVLEPRARELLHQKSGDKTTKTVVDGAVHILSHGQLSGPNFVNKSQTAPAGGVLGGPWVWWHYRLEANAAGVDPGIHFDAEYVSRLLRQIRALPSDYRARILARAPPQERSGRRATAPVVTNRYVVWLADQASDALEPVISITPGRSDAVQSLERWADEGIDWVHWLPARQNINLASDASQRFYKALARNDVALMLSVGQVRDRKGHRYWVAPDSIKPALEAGVDVRLSLAGSRGSKGQQLMPALFNLLGTARHAERITIGLAGVLSGDKPERILKPLLAHPQYFDQLRYASGYPESATAGAIDVEQLANDGFIDQSLVQPLNSIYEVNPIGFTLAVMRHVHLPHTRLKLPDRVYGQ